MNKRENSINSGSRTTHAIKFLLFFHPDSDSDLNKHRQNILSTEL